MIEMTKERAEELAKNFSKEALERSPEDFTIAPKALEKAPVMSPVPNNYKKVSLDTTNVMKKSLTIEANSKSTVAMPYQVNKNLKNNPDTAHVIETNINYINASIDADNQLWLCVNTDGKVNKKLSMQTLFEASSKFITEIYKLDESTMTLSYVTGSENIFALEDWVGFLPQNGWYYICVYYQGGSRNLGFTLVESNNYGTNEPNDSCYQAKQYNDQMNFLDYFNDVKDYDCSLLNVSENGTNIYFSILFRNINPTTAVKMLLIDFANNSYKEWQLISGEFKNNQHTLNKGLYGVMLIPTGSELIGEEYLFAMGKKGSPICPTYVYCYKIEASKDSGHMADDLWWVIGDSMTLHCSLGGAAGNVPIKVSVLSKERVLSQNTVIAYPGGFTVTVGLPPTYGKDGCWQGASYEHCYDVDAVMFDNIAGESINSQVTVVLNTVK